MMQTEVRPHAQATHLLGPLTPSQYATGNQHVRLAQLVSYRDLPKISRAITNTVEILCQLNEPDPELIKSGMVDTDAVIFVIDKLTLDAQGNLLGRVRPCGGQSSLGEAILLDVEYYKRVTFVPIITTNNRNWQYISGMYVKDI